MSDVSDKKVLYVDLDNVLVDFASGIARLDNETLREFEDRLDEVPGIFSLMVPVDGAIEAYERLSAAFDTYILSTSPWQNPSAWSDKVIWVQRYLGVAAHKRLILSHHKNLNAGHYLIDDRTKHGVDKFAGEHIHFGSSRFPNWASVLKYLLAKEG